MRVTMGVAALLILMAIVASADDLKPRAELPAAVRPLMEMARSAPPELFADTVARLVERGNIPSLSLQVELLEEAFRMAAGAKEPFRLIAIPTTPPDTRAIYRSKAGELHLDALSLQGRILKAMLTVDRGKARDLFNAIPHPSLDRRACEDPFVADVSPYYETAAALAQSAYSAAEKEKEVHVQFLTALLAGARSPTELVAFARAIQNIDLKPEEWSLLLSALAGKLGTIGADYRAFAMSISSMRSEVEQITQRTQPLGLGTDVLVAGFRIYLVAQLKAPRCREDFGEVSAAVDWFNTSFRGTLPAIDGDDMKASKRGGELKAEAYFDSEDSKRFGESISRLGFTTGGAARDEVERAGNDWHNQMASVLRDLAAWRPAGSDIDVFHQVATVLRGLLQVIPPGGDRDRVLEMCVSLLRGSPSERQSPAEWLWQVRALTQAAGQDSARLMRSFREAGASLGLFAALGVER